MYFQYFFPRLSLNHLYDAFHSTKDFEIYEIKSLSHFLNGFYLGVCFMLNVLR